MRFAATIAAGLAAWAVLTANPAQAEPTIPPGVDPDPVVAVQDLQGQVSELHDNWGALSPADRQQRLKALQQQATLVDAETRALPPGQQLQVEGMLLSTMFQLADLLRQL
ncbi:MAG: hypothetical protein U0R81_15860 [Mycobacterium sp.]